jgi:hypothetical protein
LGPLSLNRITAATNQATVRSPTPDTYVPSGAAVAHSRLEWLAVKRRRLTPVREVLHRVIAGFSIIEAGCRRDEVKNFAARQVQRCACALDNKAIHVYSIVIDGIYGLPTPSQRAAVADVDLAWNAESVHQRRSPVQPAADSREMTPALYWFGNQ